MSSPIKLSQVSLNLELPMNRQRRIVQAILKFGLWRIRGADSCHQQNNASIEVLKNINLEIFSGDRIGLIGKNGAGKSTLLKLLSGVYQPTRGEIKISGNIGSALDNNVFLIQEASGYENFKVAFGFSGADKTQFSYFNNWVQDFADIGDFYFLPVRTYSRGMLARLGMAFSLLSSPDILLVDEFLGAGDEKFQKRVSSELEEHLGGLRALIIASHSRNLLRRFCKKGCVIDKGEILFLGPLENAFEFFDQIRL